MLVGIVCYLFGRYRKEAHYDSTLTQLNHQIKWWRDLAEARGPNKKDQA
jgi:hypothetical protein